MRLKELRTDKAVTQREVSSHIGVSEIVYSRYERGIREPSLDTLVRLAEYFGVSTDFLLEREPVSGEVLTDYEKKLLSASRNADQRAREDALITLLNHAVAGEKGQSA